jgi:hypothetical protein
MSTEERLDKLEKEVDKIKERSHAQDLMEMQKYNDLEKLIAKAVEEGIEKVMQKFETIEKRITNLENAEANKALESKKELYKQIKQIAVASIVSFCLALLTNNFIAMVSNSIDKGNVNNNNVRVQEVEHEKRN